MALGVSEKFRVRTWECDLESERYSTSTGRCKVGVRLLCNCVVNMLEIARFDDIFGLVVSLNLYLGPVPPIVPISSRMGRLRREYRRPSSELVLCIRTH